MTDYIKDQCACGHTRLYHAPDKKTNESGACQHEKCYAAHWKRYGKGAHTKPNVCNIFRLVESYAQDGV